MMATPIIDTDLKLFVKATICSFGSFANASVPSIAETALPTLWTFP